MASVAHYVCDADTFPLHIINKHTTLQNVEKQYHFAALIIQRAWRGYLVRKMVKGWHRAATVLQKYSRGFLVRWHLPEIYREYLDWYRVQFYNRMATKIQALWRGYFVRRDRVPIKDLLAQRLAIQNVNEDIQNQMREAFQNMEKQKLEQMEREAKEWVLYIIFKLHHHLRTYSTEGLYSIHGRKALSKIEQLLKVLPLKPYMKELKKIYYKETQKEKQQLRPYIFKNPKLQEFELLYLKRMKEIKPRDVFQPDRNIHSKPFKLTSKIERKPYQRMIAFMQKYSNFSYDFSRPVNKSLHVSQKDFDLNVFGKLDLKSKTPPYYIDFWETICEIHNIPDL